MTTATSLTPQQPQPSTALASSVRPVDWKREAEDWLDNLRSVKTRAAYFDGWAVFVAFVATAFPEDFASGVSPEGVAQRHVIAWKREMETVASQKTGQPVSKSTMNQRLSALSSFFRFLVDRGLLASNPTDGVKRQAVSPYGKATFLDADSRQDVQLLQAVDPASQQGRRDRAILLLFLTSAVRVGVIPQLKVSSLRRQGQKTFLAYTNKGGEDLEVEIAPVTAAAIGDYLATREGLTPASPLFVATERGQRGKKAVDQPLTSRSVHYLVTSYCDKAFGPGHGIHPHSLRHTAAQVAVAEGSSITDVSRLLKHKSLAVTSVYLHATSGSDGKLARMLGQRYTEAVATV